MIQTVTTPGEALAIWEQDPDAVLRLVKPSGTSVDTGRMRPIEIYTWFGVEPPPPADPPAAP